MAIVLAPVATDNSPIGNIRLPGPQLGAFALTGITLPGPQLGAFALTGITLPGPQLGAFALTGITLPGPQLTEAVPTTLYVTATGGAKVGGQADVALDPFTHIASGGAIVAGSAEVIYKQVSIIQITAQGGVRVGGSAGVAIGWIQFNASGGAAVGGSAAVRTPVSGADAASTATAETLAAPERVILVVATSSAETTTTASLARAFEAAASSVAAVVGEASTYRLISAVVAGTAGVTTTADSTTTYFATAESFAKVLSGIQFVAAFLDGWAYNLNTGAPAFYEGFNFNSFAKVGDRYFGANSAGLFVLSGDADDTLPINALVTTGKRGDKGIYRVEAVYAGARSDALMKLTCRVEGAEHTYTFRSAPDNMAPTRVTPGKGLRGRYWQFEVANQGGADFELDVLEILPAGSARRL